MPYPLNNFTTTDNYSASSEVIFSPSRKSATMLVNNASIFYKLAPDDGRHAIGATYMPEVFVTPGRYFFDETDFPPFGLIALLSVRSGVAGVPAVVNIS